MADKKKWTVGLIFVGIALISCGNFPFLNLTKNYPIQMNMISWLIIANSIFFYYLFGQMEAKGLYDKSNLFIIIFNLMAVITGMISRFLIEFGEISNIYNFTFLNIVLHILVAVSLTCATCFFCKRAVKKD